MNGVWYHPGREIIGVLLSAETVTLWVCEWNILGEILDGEDGDPEKYGWVYIGEF